MVALVVFILLKRISPPTPSPSGSERPHLGQSSAQTHYSKQQRNADVSCFTDQIELSRLELDPSILPPTFVVFDLETTGLDPVQDEIIEIGAIRVSRNIDDVDIDATFRTLVQPANRIPRMITRINGISQPMVDRAGIPLAQAIGQFVDFIQEFPLVSFNAEFDMAFLRNAAKQQNLVIRNPTSCVLKMARLAWPGRESYKLHDLAKDSNLSLAESHHALFDCKLALVIYAAAAAILGTATDESVSGACLISRRMRAFRQNSLIPADPVERNLLGIELEAKGQIDSAIKCYQANIGDGFGGSHPYDRLAVIFRRHKDAASEIAVLTRAVEVFSGLLSSPRSDVAPKLEKFRQRLHRLSATTANTR